MTDALTKSLIERALSVRQSAYAPYSRFPVGAVLLTKNGKQFTGCNVENASYGLSICAERAAICSAIAAGEREFRTILIAASPGASPCGACRQFLVEFGTDINVISIDANDPTETKTWTSGELLPESFQL